VKKKITRIMGIALALVMVLSLMVVFAPVAGASDYKENDWGEWGLPTLKAHTDIGPMAVAPDGTLYAAIYFWNDSADPMDDGGDGDLDWSSSDDYDEWFWKVAKSEDNGYTWSDTEWDDICSDYTNPMINGVASIVVSPNYEEDELVYIGIYQDDTGDPVVVRMEDAGEGDVIYLKDFPSDENVSYLYCIDVWTDEDDYNWIAAATEEDVYVLKDRLFEEWRLQELDTWESPSIDKGYGDGLTTYKFGDALEVAFAPDFDESNLLWAIFADDDTSYGPHFWITATVSPGQWGQDVGDGWIDLDASYWLDMDFPDDYESDPDEGNCIVYAGLSDGSDNGAVWLIEGVDADDGFSNTIDLFVLSGDVTSAPYDIVSLAVSGDYGDEVILAGALQAPEIYISTDGGDNWDDVTKPPTGGIGGFSWTHVYMEADVVWGGEVFDPDEGMAFASTWGYESAVSRADDGGEVYNQVGYIDTDIDLILDLGFNPEFPDTATYLMSTFDWDDMTCSLWLTENGTDDEPDYVRVLCGDPSSSPIGNFTGWFGLVDYSWDGGAIYLAGTDEDDTTPDESVIWKSTNDGQTFGKKRSVEDDAFIRDWEIPEDDTIYAACWDFSSAAGGMGAGTTGGFYKTTNSGLSWSGEETTTNFNDIALSPDFEDGEGYILLGGMSGEIMLSDDDGDTFDDAEKEEQSDLASDGVVYVAFDADFNDEDADGYMYIYAADSKGSDIQEGKVADTDDVNWDELEDVKGDGDPQGVYCTGLQVAEDNALYAMSAATSSTTVTTVTIDGEVDLAEVLSMGATTTDADIDGPIEVDVYTGTFDNGDTPTVIGWDLEAESATVISGTVYIQDGTAEGSFDVKFIGVSGYTAGSEVDITGIGTVPLTITVSTATTSVGAEVLRLLLWESNNEWESASDSKLTTPMGLWVTPGTNVLWTIDMDNYLAGPGAATDNDPEVWALEDTLSGSPKLSSPPDNYKSDRETQMRISWDEMPGIDEDYEYKYTNVDPDVTKKDWTDETSVLLTQLSDSSEYDWKVRAAAQSRGGDNSGHDTWSSRWSDTWTFFTALGEPPWAPDLYTPGGIWQYSGIDVELMPAFSWESANTADSYQFMLSDNAEFAAPLVNEKTPEPAYLLDFELEYNTNYFWRVQAFKGTVALSRWSDVGAFTTIAEPAAEPPPPPPPATVTQPAPAPIVLPTPIPPVLLWVIIGVGAALIIAVIVLIVRTRRAV